MPIRLISRGLLFAALVFNLPAKSEGNPLIPELERLQSADITALVSAGDHLCALEERAIPALIALLDTDQTVLPASPLGAPGSVMYPGHGGPGACFQFVSYELNEIQVRAGWLLERITFNDFGFASEWFNGRRSPEERHAAAARATSWWADQHKNWTRLSGLREALRSDSPGSQLKALLYLQDRGSDGICSGLDETTYFSQIHPLVQNLLQSQHRGVRESAAAVWARTERSKSQGQRRFLIDRAHLANSQQDFYLLQDGSLILNGSTVVNIGDPLNSLTAKVPVVDFLGTPAVDTIPPLVIEASNGVITSWHLLDSNSVPWDRSNQTPKIINRGS